MDLALAPTVAAPAEARRAVRVYVQELTWEELSDLELVVTELVTNAILHGSGLSREPIDLHVRVTTEAITGSVRDQGTGFDKQEAANAAYRVEGTNVGGWGLKIVDALTHSWDVRSGDVNEVTFSMARST